MKNNKKSESHIFILWASGASYKDMIEKEISKKFTITNTFSIDRGLSNKVYFKNFKRFYGVNAIHIIKKIIIAGKGTAYAFIVEDNNPMYNIRKTTSGTKKVNTNMFDTKLYLRKLVGSNLIHGSDNSKEYCENISLLSGESNKIAGQEGRDSIYDLFNILNKNCNYLIMRNFQNLHKGEYYGQHNDIDILTDNVDKIVRLSNATLVYKKKNRVHYKTLIGGKEVFFDFRYVGDNYYCKKLQKDMLSQKIYHDFFFIPSGDLYFYTLLYHAIIHKPTLQKDYTKQLKKIYKEKNIANTFDQNKFDNDAYLFKKLTQYINNSGYCFSIPIDSSVFYNYKFLPLIAGSKRWYKMIIREILKKMGLLKLRG